MKFAHDCLGVNNSGQLTIGGVAVSEIANEYGTPAYIMSEEHIRANCRKYMELMTKHRAGDWAAAYASKAFACKQMFRIIREEGLYCDVASGGELYTALAAGMPPTRIIFHGNNKTSAELDYAIRENIHRIVANSANELRNINSIAKSPVSVSLRLSPGVTDPTIPKNVQTGILDSKFGIPIETGEAKKAVDTAATLKNIKLEGFHCHLGSPINDAGIYTSAIASMLDFMKQNPAPELNIGGGFPTKTGFEFIETICKSVPSNLKLVIEPGRSIVADAGITVYTIGDIKNISGVRKYISVDGGMTDNPRYMLYGSEHEITLAGRSNEPKTEKITLAGRCCECELLGENMSIQPGANIGDLIAVLETGAYNYSMASNYNRIPRPPVVMIKNGEAYAAVRRESYEDVSALDV